MLNALCSIAEVHSAVPTIPLELVNQNEIRAGVQRAVEALKPDVVRIRYTVTADWTGEQSVFFRVVLSDHVSAESRLREITQRILFTVDSEVSPPEWLRTYFNFRSQSEQAQLREAAWE